MGGLSLEQEIDRGLLETKLKKIPVGETLKVQIFNRNGFEISGGHSLLIKKFSDNLYLFFDPNYGQDPVNFDRLCMLINNTLKRMGCRANMRPLHNFSQNL